MDLDGLLHCSLHIVLAVVTTEQDINREGPPWNLQGVKEEEAVEREEAGRVKTMAEKIAKHKKTGS